MENRKRFSHRWRIASKIIRWTFVAISIGILIQVVLLGLPGIKSSASALRHMRPILIVAALGLEASANLCLAQLYRVSLLTQGGNITWRSCLRVSMAAFTVGHVMPMGGAAAGVFASREFTSLGNKPTVATSATIVAGAIGMATLATIVVVGTVSSLFRGDMSVGYVITATVVILIIVAIGLLVLKAVVSDSVRRKTFDAIEKTGKRFHLKLPVDEWREFAEAAIAGMPRGKKLFPLAGWSAANWLFDASVLWVLFLGFGGTIHIGVLLVGYGLANLLTALPITPGGLGFVEGGLAGVYTAFGEPAGIAVVSVLVYRLLSYWLPVTSGIVPYLHSASRSKAEAQSVS